MPASTPNLAHTKRSLHGAHHSLGRSPDEHCSHLQDGGTSLGKQQPGWSLGRSLGRSVDHSATLNHNIRINYRHNKKQIRADHQNLIATQDTPQQPESRSSQIATTRSGSEQIGIDRSNRKASTRSVGSARFSNDIHGQRQRQKNHKSRIKYRHNQRADQVR
jgi:hypothetical protein